MSARLCDREIGPRACEEIFRIANEKNQSVPDIMRNGLNIKSYSIFYTWESGSAAPSTFALQGLALIGADTNYILTGKRNG